MGTRIFGAIAILGATLPALAQENRLIDQAWCNGQPLTPVAAPAVAPSCPAPADDAPFVDGWCCGRQGWFADTGVYVFAPRWNNNPAYAVNSTTFDTTSFIDITSQADFATQTDAAPVVSLGFVGQQGLGMRARWWSLRSSALANAFNAPESDPNVTNTLYSANSLGLGFSGSSADNLAQTGTFNSLLKMSVVDLEGVWDLRPGRGSLLLGAGVRWAEVDQHYDVLWAQAALDELATNISGQMLSAHRFQGVGPTLSIEGRYPLGESHVTLFAGTRGSVLFATRRESARLDALVTDYYGAIVEIDSLSRAGDHHSVMPIGEVEIGTSYARMLGEYRLNLEAAFVAQAWFNTGNPANSETVSGTPYADTSNQDTLGLIGLRVTAGLSY
jgi:hypothetical protein